MSNISISKDLVQFFKEPNYYSIDNLSTIDRIYSLVKIFIYTYVGLFIVGFPYQILTSGNLIPEVVTDYSTKLLLLTQTHPEYVKPYKAIVIFLSPIMSGIMFFSSQTKFALKQIKFSISFILGFILFECIQEIVWYPNDILLKSLTSYLYIIVFCIVFYFFFKTFIKRFDSYEIYWNRNFKKIFYSISVLFALSQIPSFLSGSNNIISIILMLLPAVVYGFMIGYTRIKLGLLDSILLYFIFLVISLGFK